MKWCVRGTVIHWLVIINAEVKEGVGIMHTNVSRVIVFIAEFSEFK